MASPPPHEREWAVLAGEILVLLHGMAISSALGFWQAMADADTSEPALAAAAVAYASVPATRSRSTILRAEAAAQQAQRLELN